MFPVQLYLYFDFLRPLFGGGRAKSVLSIKVVLLKITPKRYAKVGSFENVKSKGGGAEVVTGHPVCVLSIVF